jgi:hypothetical protein
LDATERPTSFWGSRANKRPSLLAKPKINTLDFAMRISWGLRGPAKALLSSLSLIFILGSLLAPSPAHGEQPLWTVGSDSSPTSFVPGDETGEDKYVLTVVNSASTTADGSPLQITDVLPSGLAADSISGKDLGNGQTLSCQLTPTLGCKYEGYEIASGDVLQVDIAVKVSSGAASPAINSVTVTGGGAENGATIEDPTPISSVQAGFGVSSFATAWSDTEAGSSVNLTAGFTLNQILASGETEPAANPKDLTLDLPPGFIINPEHIQRCSVSEAQHDECQTWAAVGVAFTSSSSGIGGTPIPYSSLVYSVNPDPGELGKLMLMLPSGPINLGLRISASGGYHMQLQAQNLLEVEPLLSMTLTLWGLPGANPGPDHVLAGEGASFGGPGGGVSRFFTTAGSCGPPLPARLSVTSWTQPDFADEASSNTPSLTGCDQLPYASSFSVEPDTAEASEPAGYGIDLHSSQSTEPSEPAYADLRNATVTLPEGVNVSISAANGLQGCSETEIGLLSQAPVTCPSASKVGEVEIKTALLSHELQGSIYLAAQGQNPFGAFLAVYIVAEEPLSTASMKLAGKLDAKPVTGQLTLTLSELPQLPISELNLHFSGGAAAWLTTPSACGKATATSDLTPWNGSTSVTHFSNFEIGTGPNGGSCEAGTFNPSFQAGTTVNQAGAYVSLALLAARTSGEEDLKAIQVQAPAAVASMFTGIPACGESHAVDGTCPASSEIGTAAVAIGLGPDPYYLSGSIFLTGPYRDASQGLSIVIPFDVGPFDLGTVVVRATMQIDPGSGQMMIVSDQLPINLDGIPLHIGKLALQLSGGTFAPKPDGCEPLTVLATLVGTRGSSKSISATPFGEAPQCNPPSSPAPTAHSAVSQPPVGQVSLASTRIVASDGRTIVKVRCTGTSPCTGKLTLSIQTKVKRKKRLTSKTIGAADFSVPPGQTREIRLKLSASANSRLRANRRGLGGVHLKLVKSLPAPVEIRTMDVSLVRASSRRKR